MKSITLVGDTVKSALHSHKVDFGTSATNIKQILHLPLFNVQVPSTLILCIIFQARPKQLAVCIVGGEHREGLQTAPFEKALADYSEDDHVLRRSTGNK